MCDMRWWRRASLKAFQSHYSSRRWQKRYTLGGVLIIQGQFRSNILNFSDYQNQVLFFLLKSEHTAIHWDLLLTFITYQSLISAFSSRRTSGVTREVWWRSRTSHVMLHVDVKTTACASRSTGELERLFFVITGASWSPDPFLCVLVYRSQRHSSLTTASSRLLSIMF